MTIEVLLNKIYIEKGHIFYIPFHEYAIFARRLEYIRGMVNNEEVEIRCAVYIIPFVDEGSDIDKNANRTLEYNYHINDFISKKYITLNPLQILQLIIDKNTILKDRYKKDIILSDEFIRTVTFMIREWNKEKEESK